MVSVMTAVCRRTWLARPFLVRGSVYLIWALAIGGSGCHADGPRVVIDTSFLGNVDSDPDENWVFRHFAELQYLALKDDRAAVGCIIRAVASDRASWTECVDDDLRILAHVAYGIDDSSRFWLEISKLGAAKQAKAIFFCDHVQLIDWPTERDSYLGDRPRVKAAYAGFRMARAKSVGG